MKLLILKFGAVILVIGLLTFGALSWLRHKVSSTPCNPSSMSTYSATGWTNDPIDGDGTAFREIRQTIDALKAKGDDMVSWTNTYKEAAQKVPNDAQAQFRWGYAALLASDYERHIPANKPEVLCGVYAAMGQPKNPQSFEYARLRFLVGTLNSNYRSNRQMKEIGIRLLHKAAKDDFALRYFGINALSTEASLKNSEPLESCLKLTLELQKDFPKRIEPIRMLGGLNSSLFAVTKKSAFADRAMQYYRQYLWIVPPDYKEWRGYVKRSIRETEELREIYKKSGVVK